MAIRRYIRALGPALLLSFGGAYAVASMDWCAPVTASPATVSGVAVAQDQLRVGAAKVALTPPMPVVKAGYPPSRPDAKTMAHPLYARATVLQVGSLKVAVASVDLLTMPESVVKQVRARLEPQHFDEVWLAVTHTHSSFGGYDPRMVSELAGTGTYREAAELAVVAGATSAIEQAAAALQPVTMAAGTGKFPELVSSRSGGAQPTGELVHVTFTQTGAPNPVAQWVLFAAHPTNVTRSSNQLDPDYPGFLSRALEEGGSGPALFLQLAVGNANNGNADGADLQRAEVVAKRIQEALGKVALTEVPEPKLALAHVQVSLPRADASRLVPAFFRRAGANFLCRSAPVAAEVNGLQLGPLRLISVPGEPTEAAAAELERRSRGYPVSLVNGYLGYVESREQVELRAGEAKRQYFDETLLERLADAAETAGKMLPSNP